MERFPAQARSTQKMQLMDRQHFKQPRCDVRRQGFPRPRCAVARAYFYLHFHHKKAWKRRYFMSRIHDGDDDTGNEMSDVAVGNSHPGHDVMTVGAGVSNKPPRRPAVRWHKNILR